MSLSCYALVLLIHKPFLSSLPDLNIGFSLSLHTRHPCAHSLTSQKDLDFLRMSGVDLEDDVEDDEVESEVS